MDDVKVTLITRDFNRMLGEFSEIEPRIEFRDIVIGVGIRVIAGALRRTRAADLKKIRQRHEHAEYTTMDGKLYKLSNYFHNDALWDRIVAKRKASLKVKEDSRGLAKQSFLHQAHDLDGIIDVPSFVVGANYKGKQFPGDASHIESGGAANYALKIINTSPIVQEAGGRDALIYSMGAETRYFFTLLSKGAFRTAESRARKYPSVYVRPSAAATLSA